MKLFISDYKIITSSLLTNIFLESWCEGNKEVFQPTPEEVFYFDFNSKQSTSNYAREGNIRKYLLYKLQGKALV